MTFQILGAAVAVARLPAAQGVFLEGFRSRDDCPFPRTAKGISIR